ncbi:MAG: hypothetical protein ACP5O2_09445 [Bacteroidales bacterium]
MKKLFLAGWACMLTLILSAQSWQPTGDKIHTPWTESMDQSSSRHV